MEKIIIKNMEFDYEPIELTYESSKPLDKVIATENLLDFKKILEKYECKFALMYGTLLGAVREKGFIDHDIDIDLISFDENNLLNCINELRKAGFSFVRYEEITKTYSFMRNDCYIDVYIVSEIHGILKLKYYNLCGKLYPKKLLKNLTKIEFIGSEFNVPSCIESNLVYLYGENWEVPISNKPGVHESDIQIKIKSVIKKIIPNSLLNYIIKYYNKSLNKN